jgi:D-glycero-D-manno-heptose 1,7-bisphosphate phosphatase
LDRDGVINENRADYVRSPDQLVYIPGAFEALRMLAGTPYRIVVVSNQSAVGRGIISEEQANAINDELVSTVRRQGGRIDAAYLCPHDPRDGCDCRKPQPGMLLRAAQELNLDLGRSFLIGDALTDCAAGKAAGVRSVLVLTGRGRDQLASLKDREPEFSVAPDLLTAVQDILAASPPTQKP